jgi:hypothetical protein
VSEAATGGWASAWRWSSAGVEIVMTADAQRGPWRARNIAIAAPSKLATRRGIRIGSARAELAKKYKRSDDDEGSDPKRYLAGSWYGGLLFTLGDDKVTSVTLGVFAF